MNEASSYASDSPDSPRSARPFLITLLCAIAWLGNSQILMAWASGTLPAPRPWLPAFAGLAAILGDVCFIGFWRMRRFGVLGYIILSAAQNGVLLYLHLWSPVAIFFPVIATLVGLVTLERMR